MKYTLIFYYICHFSLAPVLEKINVSIASVTLDFVIIETYSSHIFLRQIIMFSNTFKFCCKVGLMLHLAMTLIMMV